MFRAFGYLRGTIISTIWFLFSWFLSLTNSLDFEKLVNKKIVSGVSNASFTHWIIFCGPCWVVRFYDWSGQGRLVWSQSLDWICSSMFIQFITQHKRKFSLFPLWRTSRMIENVCSGSVSSAPWEIFDVISRFHFSIIRLKWANSLTQSTLKKVRSWNFDSEKVEA